MATSIISIDNQDRIDRLSNICKNAYPKLPYHNYNHALEVRNIVKKYGTFYSLNKEDIFILESAALLHDIDYIVGSVDHEKKAYNTSRRLLPQIGYSYQEIEKIGKLILATKWPTDPHGLLEEIICDADLDNLGREDFFEKSSKLMEEWKIPHENIWYEKQLSFLENNHYYTSIARKSREKGKQENIDRLKDILGGIRC
jgi:predicted metal-dependent HD superfamily phosphohydrolase